MVKKWLFLIVGILVLPSLARADDFVLSGYTEVGKRSTAEDYEEEGTDDLAYILLLKHLVRLETKGRG